jgi:hypothetical protein
MEGWKMEKNVLMALPAQPTDFIRTVRIGAVRRSVVALIGLVLLAAGLSVTTTASQAQDAHAVNVAAVKYSGGGDWYQAQSALPNFLEFVNQNTLVDVAPQPEVVELSSDKLFSFPFLFLSGHGNVVLSEDEVRRLRRYLVNGGFLYVDDDYGIDEYIRREMKKVFPEQDFVELPFDHELYHTHYDFPNGLPKIHEHNGEAPQGFGLFHEGRLVVYYTYETNISDGWESPEVHQTPADRREAAFRMGTNILTYALMN